MWEVTIVLSFVVEWDQGQSEKTTVQFSPDDLFYRGAPLSGNYNDGSVNNQGSNGNWWSSTINNGNNMYNLNVNKSNVNPANNNNRWNGLTVRCVLAS